MKIYIENRETQVTSSEELFEELGLKEHTLYKVKVRFSDINVEHDSFLFTGFSTGGYCHLYKNSYEIPLSIESVWSLKIVKELSEIETTI